MRGQTPLHERAGRLVVVRDFDVVGIAIFPPEANPDLIVDADSVLATASTAKRCTRFPGGIASSRNSRTRLSCVSFRVTAGQSVGGHARRAPRLSIPLKRSSVAASAKGARHPTCGP